MCASVEATPHSIDLKLHYEDLEGILEDLAGDLVSQWGARVLH